MKEKADTTTILRRVVASIPYQQGGGDKLQGRAWRWAEGVHVFPEAICPICNDVMRSSCLWKLDERGQRVVSVIGIQPFRRQVDRLVKLPVNHPHVGNAGHVCMGSIRTRSVAQAVFMGMTVDDCMGRFSDSAARSAMPWVNFFNTYFTGHVHAAKRKRRPKLIKPETVRKVRARPRKQA